MALPEIRFAVPIIMHTLPSKEGYVAQLFCGGCEAVVRFEKGRYCRIVLSEEHTFTEVAYRKISQIAERIGEQLNATNAIIVGELITSRHPIYLNLQQGRGDFKFIASDLLWVEGKNLRSISFTDRRKLLELVLPAQSKEIEEAICKDDVAGMFEEVCKHDFAGIILKRSDAPYGKQTMRVLNPHDPHKGATIGPFRT